MKPKPRVQSARQKPSQPVADERFLTSYQNSFCGSSASKKS